MIYGYSIEKLRELKALCTATEIAQQTEMWKKCCQIVKSRQKELTSFFEIITRDDNYEIIFTGAGSSEFVGNSIYSGLYKKYEGRVFSYASTDLVPSPQDWINPKKRTLLISFGRSGNSPESLGAVYAAESVSDMIYHLAITCNQNGALSKLIEQKNNGIVLNLPDATHDQGFAMTSSFTSMLLTAYLCLNLDCLDTMIKEINSWLNKTSKLLEEDWFIVKDIIEEFDFERIVYLGNGSLKGIAQESALKVLELTAGQATVMHDTPMGFRHGPKSVINDRTLTVLYLSDEETIYRYERDLLQEMSAQRKENRIAVIGNKFRDEAKKLADYSYFFESTCHDKVLLGLNYLVFAQLLALFKSINLSITPDDPCPTGEVNRVVKGVILYPYE